MVTIAVSDPVKAAEFVVLIFVLQQFDGNVLGPKILGETTGLSSFWVILYILGVFPLGFVLKRDLGGDTILWVYIG